MNCADMIRLHISMVQLQVRISEVSTVRLEDRKGYLTLAVTSKQVGIIIVVVVIIDVIAAVVIANVIVVFLVVIIVIVFVVIIIIRKKGLH